MRIAFLSDLHFIDPRHDVTADDLKSILDALEEVDPDVVVALGDDGASGTERELVGARRFYRRIDARALHLAPGNHDMNLQGIGRQRVNRRNWERHAGVVSTGYKPGDRFPLIHRYPEVTLILVDTVAEDASLARGRIGERQLDLIASALEHAPSNAPIILAGHHCPSADGRGLSWTRALSDREELQVCIEDSGREIVGVFGHVHSWREWSGVLGFHRLYGTPMAKDGIWCCDAGDGLDFFRVNID